MKINWFKIDLHRILDKIENLINYGIYGDLITLLIYLRQGSFCGDCGDMEYFCKCNKCNKCKYRICLEKYNLNDLIKKEYIRKMTWEWMERNLAKKHI